MKNQDVKFEEELIDFRRSQIWMNQVKDVSSTENRPVPFVQIVGLMLLMFALIVAAHYLGWIEVAKTQGI